MDRSTLARKYRNAPNADLFDFCFDKFYEADTNHDGSIAPQEYLVLMKNMFGDGIDEEAVLADLKRGDKNKDGQITLDEWMDDLMNGDRPLPE
ncbi:hypothetical protein BDV40DRAFT_250921 [Aspergillus tamarii]|uniref:EF-hand domain-containing protein n=1 Tax=Aspergillus tamarii TaxID=41984 RepID=A0A5N6VBZ4_ASPTM|nr:hypothetical protein BDV40DRAFT_250921 [Aspergillus tamarii]